MNKKITVKLELGDNLKEAINTIVNATDAENKRLVSSSIPIGSAVERAFGIDFTEMVKVASKSEKSDIEVKVS